MSNACGLRDEHEKSTCLVSFCLQLHLIETNLCAGLSYSKITVASPGVEFSYPLGGPKWNVQKDMLLPEN